MRQFTENEVLDAFQRRPLVAVVRLPELSTALPLARALAEGGVGAIEFTFTSDDAPAAIRSCLAELPAAREGELLIGAGTVLSPEQAHAAAEAGAAFLVSPVSDPTLIGLAGRLGVPFMPGALTPTEILNAWRAGAAAVKVFPAGVMGAGYLKDLLAPLPSLRLMPTGGIGLENVGDYLRNGALAVGMGGSLVDATRVAAGEWEALRDHARACVRAIEQARGSV